jgi:hypothetical protein
MLAFLADPQTPIGRQQLQERYPRVSFPADLEKADLTSYGVISIREVPMPECDYRTERVVQLPVKQVDGVWTQQWDVQPLSAEEQQVIVNNHAEGVRRERNARLAACDWTQLPDTGLDGQVRINWAKYRAELRNVPSQTGFPWSVTWPQQPE